MLLGVLAASPAQAASTADGDGQRVVRVGTEGTYPPFTYVDPRTSQLTGYDIEVIKAVAKEAGWKLKFVQSPFDAIFPALDAKRIDVVANQVTINPEREARYLFTKPYTYSHGVIVTAADTKGIKTLADLKGRPPRSRRRATGPRSRVTQARRFGRWRASPRPRSCSCRVGSTRS